MGICNASELPGIDQSSQPSMQCNTGCITMLVLVAEQLVRAGGGARAAPRRARWRRPCQGRRRVAVGCQAAEVGATCRMM